MKRSEVKIVVTFGEILDSNYINAWDHFCDHYGYNPWIINEGRALSEDKTEISLDHAELYGIIEKE